MSGWKRIGVVLSTIWTAMVFAYAAYEYSRFPLEPFTTYLSRPDYTVYEEAKNFNFIVILGTPGQEAISSAERTYYEKLIREAATESERQSYIASRDLIHYSSGVAWGILLSAILIPVGLVWALSTIGFRTFVWVRKGFNVKP